MERLEKIEEIRQSLDELRERGTFLKENLIELEQIITREEFLNLDAFKSIRDEFFDWFHKVSNCLELYEKFFGTKPPKTFSEVEKILSAEEKRIIDAHFFSRAEKFLLLIAENPDTQKTLVNYQKKLKILLAKKSRDAKVKATAEPYVKFIDVLDEVDVVKKFSVGKELSEFFGDDFIGRSLFGDELYFDKADNLDILPEVEEKPTLERFDLAKTLEEEDAFLSDEDFAAWEESFNIVSNNQKEITAKKFRKDVKERWFTKEAQHILLHAALDSCFSLVMLRDEKKFSSSTDFETTAEILINRGYIQKCTFGKFGGFYTLTKEFFDFLKKDNSKEFLKNLPIKIKNIKSYFFGKTEFLNDNVRFSLTRMIFLKLHDVEVIRKNIFGGIKLLAQSFQAKFSGKDGLDLVIGCFWNDSAECDKFLDDLENFSDKEKFDRVIIAGFTFVHGAKIFNALKKILNDITAENAAFYIYSVEEDDFYINGDSLPIDIKEIWSASPDEEIFNEEDDEEEIINEETPAEEPPIEELPDKKSVVEESPAEEIQAEEDFIIETPADEMRAFNNMLFGKKFYCAAAYVKALSLQNENYTPLYNQLAYAINDPLLSISYSSNGIISLFNESAEPDEYFLTAATLRTFFYNHKQFDYDMKTLHGIVKNFSVVEENSPLADLIFMLMNFKETAKNGVDYYADYRLKDRAQTEIKIVKLRQEARTFLERIKNFKEKANNPRFIETKKVLFDGSELTNYLEYMVEDNFDEAIFNSLKNYLQEKFIKDAATLSLENLDRFKFDTFIDEAWEAAGDNIRRKKNMNLVGELRSNLSNLLKKAIEILCERVTCYEESAPLQSDVGAVEYNKIRAGLLDKISVAKTILNKKKSARGCVLIETLQEIADKLEGTFEPVRHKYFYVDFLRGDKILLDENYFPTFNFNTLDGTSNSVAKRVVAHSRIALPTFEERVKNIFEERGWDFGTAQLIDAYIEEIAGKSVIEQNKYKLQESLEAVKRIALNDKKKFFGFLELAQSYGQFDAAPENVKEKILKLIDRCFEFSQKTDNLGVFFRIKKYWENKIKEDAAEYSTLVEKNLESGIKNYCRKTGEEEDSPALKKSVERILKMIGRRNYTVAQGLINSLSEGKIYSEPELLSQTHLQHFLEDYGDYYDRVRKSGESFKNLVGKSQKFSKAATSKGIKGGEILTDNWIPNGFPQNNDVGEERLGKLLTALGFKVESVKKTGAINKDALNYKVKLTPPANGQSSNYNHPIAAFGSNAEIYGFRVTCIFGTYNAEGLITRFKEIGNAENTLVLLDYALELPTRRSLARKIKAESGITKIFAVVDRVLMMYLVKNYDAMQINKMLMSLTMPFANCQPYVFNPNVPIPPEIFIGREKELRRILDFDDVNIVYGGRQLGKTALLKMACASLDRNENNDRAIFIDVNKCDCAAAALKIGRALRAEKFFDETFADTDDWEKLAAAIKMRLASSEPDKIPHFMIALDEADDFIKSCREIDFKPILELIDIQQQRHDGSRFKFVMAGLRDVVRFYRNESLDNNNQISKLPTLAVKPFDLEDASKLLKEPLRCLGLYFSDDENSDSLAMMILETTNYFPGLIQLYCARLIEALSRADYAGYNENDSPVYEIKEGHIQSVLGEESFNEEIKNKVNMTLRLGDDKFYYVIAHLMAWRYHKDDNIEGYSAQDIFNTADEYGLEELLPPSVEQIEAILKELCELNILREVDKGKYLFVRQRFLSMMGTSEELEAEIMSDFSGT